MAFWVAGETGRSLNGDGNKAKIDAKTTSEGSNSSGVENKAPKVASPLEKLAVNEPLRWWRERQRGGGDGDHLPFELASSYSNR